jgi:hypothetical protein
MSDEERIEQHQELITKEKQLRRQNIQSDNKGKTKPKAPTTSPPPPPTAEELGKLLHPGATVKHTAGGSLQGMMGDVWDAAGQRKAIRERRMTLRAAGKISHAEVENTLRAEFVKAHEGKKNRY